ncbi:limulus clotting factor C-like [Limulus polyphemus]|uniref:Limulus clotting factor C-like n=1 Tax=Limulus polyphemus TaxID=6850 RepID=A0ABM1S453_LIMPO|nr:limulus clotting factor C-like [Limulus polyphemus]
MAHVLKRKLSSVLWLVAVFVFYDSFILVHSCGYPGSPTHASVKFTKEVVVPGTEAIYNCDQGFELIGPPRRVCKENGTWTPSGIPFCVLNIAAGKAPMQSSVADKGNPQKAVDGSTSALFNSDTCTMTKAETGKAAWWYVNLLEPFIIQLVRVDFGTSCCSNNGQATIVVRVGNNRPDLSVNPICSKFTGTLTLSIKRCPYFRNEPHGNIATYNGKCYIFYNSLSMTFQEAKQFCSTRKGSIIDETSPSLQGFLSWELYKRHKNDPNSHYWLGAVRDPTDRNNWKWISGKDVTISFWNLQETNENCSQFDGAKGWLWSDTNCNHNLNVICQYRPTTCPKPARPTNSTILARDFKIGSVVEYTCLTGHILVGPKIRTCLPNGVFSEYPPKCIYLQCGPPAIIPNGGYELVNGTRNYLSSVQYFCDEGYVFVGRAFLVCDVDERWNGPPPRCEPVICSRPPGIDHGIYRMTARTTTFGTIVEYICNPGYRLIGQPQLKCDSSGYWDGKVPVCRKETQVFLPLASKASIEHPTTLRKTRPMDPENAAIPHSKQPHLLPRSSLTNRFKSDSVYTRQEGPNGHSITISTTPSSFFINQMISFQRNLNSQDPNKYATYTSSEPSSSSLPIVNFSSSEDAMQVISNVRTESPFDTADNVENQHGKKQKESLAMSARLNMGGIIALGVFGGFVFLAAVITIIVIIVRSSSSVDKIRKQQFWNSASPHPSQNVGYLSFYQ